MVEPMYAFDIHCNVFFPVIVFSYFGNVSDFQLMIIKLGYGSQIFWSFVESNSIDATRVNDLNAWRYPWVTILLWLRLTYWFLYLPFCVGVLFRHYWCWPGWIHITRAAYLEAHTQSASSLTCWIALAWYITSIWCAGGMEYCHLLGNQRSSFCPSHS